MTKKAKETKVYSREEIETEIDYQQSIGVEDLPAMLRQLLNEQAEAEKNSILLTDISWNSSLMEWLDSHAEPLRERMDDYVSRTRG